MYHIPVMVEEVLDFLNPEKGDIIVDATFGFGGHSLKILEQEKNLFIIGIEKDKEIFKISEKRFKNLKKIKIVNEDFENIDFILEKLKIKGVNKILFDFGLSSYHIEHSKRGFSFKREEILDMRYDTEENTPLWKKIKRLKKEELERIIKEYGEEPFYKKISLNIFREREKIKNTFDLNRIIEKSVPIKYQEKAKHRVYQAFRIFVNRELEKIKNALLKSYEFLFPGGRIVCLSYHSLEDRIIKRFFKEKNFRILTPKPIKPSKKEIDENPRARSCRLRCAEKI